MKQLTEDHLRGLLRKAWRQGFERTSPLFNEQMCKAKDPDSLANAEIRDSLCNGDVEQIASKV